MAEAAELEEPIVKPESGHTLKTHRQVLHNHGYELIALFEGHAKVKLFAGSGEILSDKKLLYEGSIFSCASFTALAAVNDDEMFLLSAKCSFLSPIRDTEEILFEANVTTNSSGKKEVQVTGTVNELEVFGAEFVLMKLDERSRLKPQNGS